MGTLNLEWTATTLYKSAAISDDTIANTISQWKRTMVYSVLYRNVLPVPPGINKEHIRAVVGN